MLQDSKDTGALTLVRTLDKWDNFLKSILKEFSKRLATCTKVSSIM